MDKFEQSVREILTGKGEPNFFQRGMQCLDRYVLWLVPLFAWLCFWWPVVSGESQLFARDLTFYALPLKTYLMERFAQGEFPMWTPRISGGMPFFAELSNQVLYPLNFLYGLTGSAVQGISWQIALEHLLGFWTMAYLARVVGLSKWTSLWVSLVYGFCGYNLGVADNINYHPAVAWVPLMLAFFIRGVQQAFKEVALPWRWVLAQATLTALPLGILILAGDTFSPLFLGLFATTVVFGLSVVWGCKYKRRSLRPVCQLWFHWAFSFGFVFLLCAVQILPSWELMQYSVRQNMLEYHEVTLWSFPWERLVELAIPYFYGTRFPEPRFLGMFLYPQFREPWADSVYVGLVTVFFAGIGFFCTKGFLRWLFAWMAVFAILLGAGMNAAYYPLLVKLVPVLKTQRYLEKFMFFTTIGFSLLAGLGVHAFSAWYEALMAKWSGKGLLAKIGVTLGLFAALSLLLVQLPAQAWIWPHNFERSLDWGAHFYARGPHVAGLYLHFLLLLLPLLLLLWVNRTLVSMYLPFLLVLGVADLFMVHYPHFPIAPTALLRDRPAPSQVPVLKRLAGQFPFAKPMGDIRLYYDDMVDGTDTRDEDRIMKTFQLAYRLPYLTDTYAFQWIYRVYYNQERLLFNYGCVYGFNYQNGRFAPLQLKLHKQMDMILTQEIPTVLMQLSNVHYVVTPIRPQNAVWETPGFREVYRDPGYNLKILAVENTLPNAYVAPNRFWNTEPESVYLALIESLRERPLQEWAELSPLDTLAMPRRQASYQPPQAWQPVLPAALSLKKNMPEDIEINVTSPYHEQKPLVFVESWFPGWHAFLDGKKEIPVLLANHRFLGVMVPPGKHRVRFRYESAYFKTGLLISSLSALWLLGVLCWRARQPGKQLAP